MRKKFVALCVPSLGQVSSQWAMALPDLMWPMNTGRVHVHVIGKPVAEARNHCVANAISWDNEDREVTHLFWLDDDVIPARQSLIHLLRHDRDIVSGVYFSKGDGGEPLIFPGRGCGTLPFIPDKVQEVWGHGMGLTLVKADVYRRMQRDLDLPKDKFGNPEWYKTPGPADSELEHGSDPERPILWCGGTEDLWMLNRAGEMGYKPLADCSSNCFGWHIDLKSNRGYPEKQFKQAQAGGPVIWDTPDGPKQWE